MFIIRENSSGFAMCRFGTYEAAVEELYKTYDIDNFAIEEDPIEEED